MQEPDAATTTVRQTVDVFRQSGLSAYDVDTTVMFRKLILEKGNTLTFFRAVLLHRRAGRCPERARWRSDPATQADRRARS